MLFANTGDGVLSVDGDLRIVLANPAAKRLLPQVDTGLVGRPCYEVFKCHAAESGTCRLFEMARAGKPIGQHDMLVCGREGQRTWLNISTIVVPAERPPAPYLVLLFRLARPGQEPVLGQRPRLRVRCLGEFGVVREDTPVTEADWGRRKFRSVFKYLLAHRDRWVTRDELVDAFWPELELKAAFHNVRVALSAIRRALEPNLLPCAVSQYLLVKDDVVRFVDDGSLWVDAAEFEERVRQAMARPEPLSDDALAVLEQSVDLYRGDYLSEDLYEDWPAAERQRLLDLYLAAQRRLAGEYLRRGQVESAMHCLQRIIQRCPADEEARRDLIAALARAGRRPEALRQYHAFATFLYQELGVEPSPETTRLHRLILEGRYPSSAPHEAPPPGAELQYAAAR